MDKLKKTNKKLEQRGITLIALVVTIIVLLILAGISIQMLSGQSGILTQARQAKERNAHSEVYDTLNLDIANYLIESYTEESAKDETVIQYLLKKEYIYVKENITGYIINVEKLLGKNIEYGKGTDGKTDVYKLERNAQGSTSILGVVSSFEKIASTKMAFVIEHNLQNPQDVPKENFNPEVYNVIYYGKTGESIKLGSIIDQYIASDTVSSADSQIRDSFSVTYTDGVPDEVVFDDQTYTVKEGGATPAFQFNGVSGANPEREGYNFEGWAPTVADEVTEDATYEATWSRK